MRECAVAQSRALWRARIVCPPLMRFSALRYALARSLVLGQLLIVPITPSRVVCESFSRWLAADASETMHDALRQRRRARSGREPEPDRGHQRRAMHTQHGPGRLHRFDAGKKVKGRKRRVVVDAMGLLRAVAANSAGARDREPAPGFLAQACDKLPGLMRLYADSADAGRCALTVEKARPEPSVQVGLHSDNRSSGTWHDEQQSFWPDAVASGFDVQTRRLEVARTHPCNERARRLVAHLDRSPWALRAVGLARRSSNARDQTVPLHALSTASEVTLPRAMCRRVRAARTAVAALRAR